MRKIGRKSGEVRKSDGNKNLTRDNGCDGGKDWRDGEKNTRTRRKIFGWREISKRIFGKIHQSWFVVAMCVGVVFGTIVGLVFRISFFDSWVWVVVAAMILVVCYFQPRAFLVILAVGAGMVMALFKISSELAGEDFIGSLAGRNVVVAGTIDGDPETEDGKTKFKLRDLEFDSHAVKGNIYVSMSANGKLARGDEVVLSGKMSEGFGTYAGFLSRPKVEQWARPSPGDLALEIRNWFAGRVKKAMKKGSGLDFGGAENGERTEKAGEQEMGSDGVAGEEAQTGAGEKQEAGDGEEVGLGLSYLLGMKTGLNEELSENLRTVGLTHIVVASGAHLSILVEIAKKIFGRASKFVGVGASLIFVLFFMALVGWTPSIMRAGLMSILKLLAETVGRKFAAWRIILLVAAGTLLVNPMYIINLGWLLSFASFAGIMILGPKLTKFFYGERRPKFIASTILTTLAATLMTLPITLYYFGAVSLISVLPNMLILPTLPYAMGAVFLAGLSSGLGFLETAMGFLATKMLDFHIGVVGFFGQMKSFLVEMPTERAEVFWLYGVFLVVAVLAWGWQFRKKRREREVLIE